MNNLGGMYEMGWGTPADKNKAIEAYTKAAQKGNQLARDNLRRLGVAVPDTADAGGALTTNTPGAAPEAPIAPTSTPKSDSAVIPPAAAPPSGEGTALPAGAEPP